MLPAPARSLPQWSLVLLGLTVLLLLTSVPPAGAQAPRVLDDFRSATGWKVITADGVKLAVTREDRPGGSCLRLDYDFVSGGGFCLVEKAFPLDLPENYEMSFLLRGQGRENNLEFKMLDESGDNVWWVIRRNLSWPGEWRRLVQKRRHFEFAWGPAGPVPFKQLARLQFAISSAQGGKGSLWLADLQFREIPPPSATKPAVKASATSEADAGHAAVHAMSGEGGGWRSAADAKKATLTIDLGQATEMGGLVIEWDPERVPSSFTAEVQDEGASKPLMRRGIPLRSLPSFAWLPDTTARVLRLEVITDRAGGMGVKRLSLLTPDEGASTTAFLTSVARRTPAGTWPRALLGKQSFWTVVGASGEHERGLINEQGAVEAGARQFSIEPFVHADGRMWTWADATHDATLRGGGLPIPTVERNMQGLRLRVTAFEDGPRGRAVMHVRYTLDNQRKTPVQGASLMLAVRPVQVNPPWQFLNNPGGAARIESVGTDQGDLVVNGSRRVAVVHPRDNHRLLAADWAEGETGMRFTSGNLNLLAGTTPGGDKPSTGTPVGLAGTSPSSGGLDTCASAEATSQDADGLASGGLAWAVSLAPGQSASFLVSIPMFDTRGVHRRDLGIPTDAQDFAHRLNQAIAYWVEQTGHARIHLPASARALEETWTSQLAYILVNRDGPALTPGARSYDRSWIRDGAMMCVALLAAGHTEAAREFIDWYAPRQFANGKVPCVVDRRGPDPVPEHDSHGQLIYALANYYKHTGDKAILRRHYGRVKMAVDYIEAMRNTRKTPEYANAQGLKRACYGLMPESISHEGYSAKAMHSYWDDFWVMRGLEDAVFLATVLGQEADRARLAAIRDDFRKCLHDSIALATGIKGIGYLPGCVELGDFDSTSTTAAVWPCQESDRLPAALVTGTFERYWSEFQKRKTGAWKDYTPYELRHVGVLARLGQRERALEALDWYMQAQRPTGFRHWAEVIWHDRDTPKFIGDMPHTWVAADFLNSMRALLAYERDRDQALVLFAGVPERWLDEGVSFTGLVTRWGRLDASVRRERGEIRIRVASQRTPEGGCVIDLPASVRGGTVTVNGKPAPATGALHLRELPAEVRITP